MLGENVVTAEQREVAVKALAVAGYDGFDAIGFSRSRFDSGTRGAFVAKGEFCVFVAPDAGAAAVMKATDETGQDSVKQMLADLADKVDTIEAPVIVQTQAEFDYTPSEEGGIAPGAEPAKQSDIDKAIDALKAMNAAFEPVAAAPQQTDMEQSFLKSVGAQRFTPALRYHFAQSLAPKLAERLAALQRARDAL